MKIFGVWIFSIILSYIMELVSGLCIYKRAADQGYKINNKKLSETIKSFGANNNNKLEKIIYFVPFANITYAFLKSLDSTRYLDSYLDQLDALGFIDKMSDFEINKYNKKPTLINSALVPIIYDALISAADVYEDNQDNKIYYVYDKNDELVILKSEGAIANKTLEEQKEYLQKGISNELADLIQEVIDELSKIKTKENSHSGDRLTEIENQKNALIKKREELSGLNQSMNNDIKENEENQIIDSDDISNDEEMKLKLNKKNKDTK